MLSAKITSFTLKQLSSEVTTMEEKKLNIYEKLSNIQCELKAPKNQYNIFGKYNYRNCEDILEAVKPLCNKHKVALMLDDEICMIGDRHYVQAEARLYDWENEEAISVRALARESAAKKGMDDAQVTGATSSYARKYALNGLFCIDDTKDTDTNESKKEQDERQKKADKERLKAVEDVKKQIDILKTKWKTDVYSDVVKKYVISLKKVPTIDIDKLTTEQLRSLENIYQGIIVNKEKHAVADGNG